MPESVEERLNKIEEAKLNGTDKPSFEELMNRIDILVKSDFHLPVRKVYYDMATSSSIQPYLMLAAQSMLILMDHAIELDKQKEPT
jgi:hypothetical protein